MTELNPASAPESDMPAVTARAQERLEVSLGSADAILAMRRRAERLLAGTPPEAFEGFSALVAQLLPRGRHERARLAAAVGMPVVALEGLVEGEHSPLEVAPAAVAELGYAAGLDRATLLALVDRDATARAAADRDLGVAGYSDKELAAMRARLLEAWAEQELPTGDEDSTPVA